MKYSAYFIDHRGAHVRLTRWRRLRAQWRRRDIGIMPLVWLTLVAGVCAGIAIGLFERGL